jgi:hypothetical protein
LQKSELATAAFGKARFRQLGGRGAHPSDTAALRRSASCER